MGPLGRRIVRRWGRPGIGAVVLLLGVGLATMAGCAHPSAANIQLRKDMAEKDKQIQILQRQHSADESTIRGLQDRVGVLPTLPQERLAKLFTVTSIKLTRLTGGFDLNHSGGPDNGVRAYVQLFDSRGDVLKAAGTFTVEVFDLSDEEHPLVAKKHFPVEGIEQYWYPLPFIYSFVLPVPFEHTPKHSQLTVKVTYVDELTQRLLTAQAIVEVHLGASTQATTGPSGS